MNRNKSRLTRHNRVRSKVFGTASKPRLVVFRSLKNLYVQVIDDVKGVTLVAADLKEVAKKDVKNNIENATKLGELIAKKCTELKIKDVVFDRGGYKYHGKVKALAEGARKGGLNF